MAQFKIRQYSHYILYIYIYIYDYIYEDIVPSECIRWETHIWISAAIKFFSLINVDTSWVIFAQICTRNAVYSARVSITILTIICTIGIAILNWALSLTWKHYSTAVAIYWNDHSVSQNPIDWPLSSDSNWTLGTCVYLTVMKIVFCSFFYHTESYHSMYHCVKLRCWKFIGISITALQEGQRLGKFYLKHILHSGQNYQHPWECFIF